MGASNTPPSPSQEGEHAFQNKFTNLLNLWSVFILFLKLKVV